jgi:hypothetical protein
MSSTTFQIKTFSKRMLDEKESAHHCGLPLAVFKRVCPVKPVKFPGGPERYDVRDLDAWLDSLKTDNADVDAILEKLR